MAEWPRQCEQCGKGIKQVYRGRPRKYCPSCAHDVQQYQIAEYRFMKKEEAALDKQIGGAATRSHLNRKELIRRGLAR